MAEPEYELFAIRYATREARRSEHFIGGDPHDGPMPMDYFMWVAKGGGRTFVIDTGFNAEVSKKRNRTFLRCPVETLGAFDIDVNAVEDVILTHLHYDHVGNFDRFPNARFHLQEREMAYATGRFMRYPRLSHSFEVEDVCGIVRLNYARRVMFYDGDAELAPGLTIHAAGGHSAGLQFVRVRTRRGFVVLASDVSHFYENMASERPFTTALHIGEMLEGFEKLLALAPDESHIVPGHDPLVMKLYPAPSPALEGIAVRLDVPPSGAAPVRADFLRGISACDDLDRRHLKGGRFAASISPLRLLRMGSSRADFAFDQVGEGLWSAALLLHALGAELRQPLFHGVLVEPLAQGVDELVDDCLRRAASARTPRRTERCRIRAGPARRKSVRRAATGCAFWRRPPAP